MPRLVVTKKLILENLPQAPEGYSHRVEKVSASIYKVMLDHPPVYSYTSEPVSTVWGFIKGDKVHRPKTATTAAREVLCPLLDASSLSGYTSIIPTKTVLTD